MITSMDVQNPSQSSLLIPGDLPFALLSLIHNLKSHKHQMTPTIVRECLLTANIQAEDLHPWADFDHPVEHSYGRRLVYDGGDFEIMVMSWVPGDFSAIHDHGGTQWGAVQSFGEATHLTYQLTGNHLSTLAKTPFRHGSVNAVDQTLIHQMGNSGQSEFLSLHVYGGVPSFGSVTGNARLFDLFEGSIQYTDGGVFFCLPEDHINRRVTGLRGDIPTTQRHNQLMLDRLYRMLANSGDQRELREKANLLEARINQRAEQYPLT